MMTNQTKNKNNSKIYIREYNQKKVITAWDIAIMYNKKPKDINTALKYNTRNFTEGHDYFKIPRKKFLKIFENFQHTIPNNNKHINLFTATGYLKIIKTFQIKHNYKKIQKMYEKLDGKDNINLYITNIPKEIYFKESLFEAFKILKIKIIHQFQIDVYRVDFYIPEYNIVIEYDEEHHRNNYFKDKLREKIIKEKLNCIFIRCNAQHYDIKNIMKILNHLFIFKHKTPIRPKILEEQFDEFLV